MRVVMVARVRTHWTGYLPTVDSPLSITASACSKAAFATSVTSARVGMGFEIMDSSMWVATMTGRSTRRHFLMMRRWMMGSSSMGHSMPRSPRAIMMPWDSSMMESMLLTASWCSILAMARAELPCEAMVFFSRTMSSGPRQKLREMKSTAIWQPRATSARSLAVRAGRFTRTPGRLMWRREPRVPSVRTWQRMRLSNFSRTFMRMTPLSTRTTSPTEISSTRPS